MRQLPFYAGLVVVLVAIDQWIKYLVETRLVLHEMVELLPFLALYRTYNTGVAFSMFASFSDTILIVVSIAVIVFILYLASRSTSRQWFARIGFTLIIGGALGNLIDRAVYGHVIDYTFLHTPVWSFAVFNLADVFITIGAGMVLLEEFLLWRHQRSKGSTR